MLSIFHIYLGITSIWVQACNLLTISPKMWRTKLLFWTSAELQSAFFLTMIQKLYLYVIIALVVFLYISALQSCWWQTNTNDTKALYLCELHFPLIIKSRPLNLQLTNKQPINLLYNDVKNLMSILSCCIGPYCVFLITYITLSLCDNYISIFWISQHYNHFKTDNQLINLLYNDVKNLTSILSCCIGSKFVSSNNGT